MRFVAFEVILRSYQFPVAVLGTERLGRDASSFPFLRNWTHALVAETGRFRPNACATIKYPIRNYSPTKAPSIQHRDVCLPESKTPMITFFPYFPLFHIDSFGTFPASFTNPKNSHERVVCILRSRLGNTETTSGDSAHGPIANKSLSSNRVHRLCGISLF